MDPRLYQIATLASLLVYGMGWLEFDITPGRAALLLTTPNQRSVLSVFSLAVRGRFAAFPDASYPVHRTALLPVDLIRIARDCGLEEPELAYTASGRIPLTASHYPRPMSRMFPRALSDNVLMIARKKV